MSFRDVPEYFTAAVVSATEQEQEPGVLQDNSAAPFQGSHSNRHHLQT